MLTLPDLIAGDSQLLRVDVTDADGVTQLLPLSCEAQVYNADTGLSVHGPSAGSVSLGAAEYNWSGSATIGAYEAVLTVTVSAGVIKTERFRFQIVSRPPSFTTALSSDIGQLRMRLGDTLRGQGVKPDRSNFTDEELQWLLDQEENDTGRALAFACETLAVLWTPLATLSQGGRSEQGGTIADQWAKRAATLRETYGYADIGTTMEGGAVTLGFTATSDVESEEVV